MIIHFKSALNQIKAEDELVSKTEIYLRNELAKNKNTKINKYIKRGLLSIPKNLAIAACLAVLFIGGATGTYAHYQTPVSYLSLDINSSVELGVNSSGKVVKAEGYNKDGKAILNGIDMTGSNLTEAVNSLISSAVNNGFISKDGSTVISLTSETDDANAAATLKIAAETGANEALKKNGKSAVIHKDNVSLSERKGARDLGVTPGKLNLINKLKSIEPAVTVDQYKDASVTDIMKKIEKSNEQVDVKVEDKGVINGSDENGIKDSNEESVTN